MSVWKKTLLYLGLVEEDEMDGQLDLVDETPQRGPVHHPQDQPGRDVLGPPAAGALTAGLPPARSAGAPHRARSPSARSTKFRPAAYDDAKEIGDKLKSSVPVIMNLQGVEDDTFKRLTAFASGLPTAWVGMCRGSAPACT